MRKQTNHSIDIEHDGEKHKLPEEEVLKAVQILKKITKHLEVKTKYRIS